MRSLLIVFPHRVPPGPFVRPAVSLFHVADRGWDDDIPEAFALSCLGWLVDLLNLSNFCINRVSKRRNSGNLYAAQLHNFWDAREYGFANDKQLRECSYSLYRGKSVGSPVKQTNGPRTELATALVAIGHNT